MLSDSWMISDTSIIEPQILHRVFKSNAPTPTCFYPRFDWFLLRMGLRPLRVVDWGFVPSLHTTGDPTGKAATWCAGIRGSTTERVICMTGTQANNRTWIWVCAHLLSSSQIRSSTVHLRLFHPFLFRMRSWTLQWRKFTWLETIRSRPSRIAMTDKIANYKQSFVFCQNKIGGIINSHRQYINGRSSNIKKLSWVSPTMKIFVLFKCFDASSYHTCALLWCVRWWVRTKINCCTHILPLWWKSINCESSRGQY